VEQVSATRTELLARRAQIDLAIQGRDLLNEKRDQLLEEFRRVADVVLGGANALERSAAEGRRLLAIAEASDGPEAVLSAAFATRGDIPLEASTTSIMGVRIARIDHQPVGRPRTGRGYSLTGTDPRIDAVAEAYEAQLELVLEVATTELRLRRLAEEIGKTTRRVNALEFVVIPRLVGERKRIQAVLEERERQDHFRLKRVKEHKAKAPRRARS
jgi:V/A-type H+-transporting ATPase subunit D